ncbi:branched-chain amino acid ABC transporter substrate-binding protein [Zhengella mangrovi]|uniref:Branched-chain amino acid ABC transporter substrate-binding protein n=1 Tax=Zhengella mangrovi TaxID=1982044 RepID=A0A2G1QM86_9HYPH|nr:branched-chain amino acid ABC transporter substrate-binding protein [Zhengella mangrovi]PHP66647.1 branched-chain amino acid ABC transporter substrate-binding protein [Zhengella mangrovi]
MRRVHLILLPLVAAALAPAAPAEAATIGFAAPLSGFAEPLGRQMEAGVRLAAGDHALVATDTGCSGEGGTAAARELAANKVAIVVGFLCTEALEAALPVLTAAGIPVITPGVRTDALTDRRDKTGWLIWRTAPRGDAEREAAGRIIPDRWRKDFFAIIDDGTIAARELAETVRLQAELARLNPVFVDTFRPQLPNQIALAGRLKRAGATHVFAGGDRRDIAILARDLAGLDAAMTIAGGEALVRDVSDIPLPAGTLAIAVPDANNALPEALRSDLASANVTPEGYVAPGYMAASIAIRALGETTPDSAAAWHERLDGKTFETPAGSLTFDAKGDRATNPYQLLRFDGETWEPAG